MSRSPLDALDRVREMAVEAASTDPRAIEVIRRYFVLAIGSVARLARAVAWLAIAIAVVEAIVGIAIASGCAAFVGWSALATITFVVLFVLLIGLIVWMAHWFSRVAAMPVGATAVADSLKERIVELKPHIVAASEAKGFVGRLRSIVFVGRALWHARQLLQDDLPKLDGVTIAMRMAAPPFWILLGFVAASCFILPMSGVLALIAMKLAYG